MKKKSKIRTIIEIAAAFVLGAVVMTGIRYIIYGGLSTNQQVNHAEFQKYAGSISDITLPENVKIVALGEAAHGNKEFQELKLEVFQKLVEEYGCKTFALEADYGGSLIVNEYIHKEAGITEDEAVKALIFRIYQTDEIRALIRYMADYNQYAKPEDMLSFYGFDMQNYDYAKEAVDQAFEELDMQYRYMDEAEEILSGIPGMELYAQAARCCMQNQELGKTSDLDYSKVRDGYMAENISWIYDHAQEVETSIVMISGHNGHVAKKHGNYTFMGENLYEKYGDDYFVLGTDFYKSACNLPGKNGKRITRSFYSADPLANTANALKMDLVYLDFLKLQESEKLSDVINHLILMGSLGENYSILNKIFPYTYRINETPAELYDGMILIRNATPTVIEGRQTNNADEYSIEFTGKNQSEETVFALEKGGELDVIYQVEKGKVDLVIGIPGGKPIYTGNGITDGDFTVTADQTGEYVVSIEAKNAAGYLRIKKAN